jgi:hypothetical protein
MGRISLVVLLLIVALDVTATPSYAYLDPGAGSQFLQMTLAGGLGLLFVIKTLFAKFLQAVRLRRRK